MIVNNACNYSNQVRPLLVGMRVRVKRDCWLPSSDSDSTNILVYVRRGTIMRVGILTSNSAHLPHYSSPTGELVVAVGVLKDATQPFAWVPSLRYRGMEEAIAYQWE